MIVSEFFVPVIRDLFRGSFLFLLPPIIFFLLGLALIFLTVKQKTEGVLKKFLILTGTSSTGFFVGIFLHNAFYALGTITSQIIVLNYLVKALEVAFFFIAIACPVGFLIGIVGSVLLFIKKR